MTNSDIVTPNRSGSDVRTGLRISRYDLMLAIVPAAFVVGLFAVRLVDVPLQVAMASAAAVGALALIDGLFLNPPKPPARNGPA